MNQTPDPLTSLRAKHPGWHIELVAGPRWIAVEQPTRTAENIVHAATLDELAAKLAEADRGR